MAERHNKRLDTINEELEEMRGKHSRATLDYYELKASFDFEVAKYLHEQEGEPGTKGEKEAKALMDNEDLYKRYKKAHGLMDAFDRNVKNLDIQRSNIQSQMKAS